MTEKEYNQCVKEHADGVFRFILKNLRNKEDARDVVQTAFEKMWTSRATVDSTRCRSFSFYSCLSPDDRPHKKRENNNSKSR